MKKVSMILTAGIATALAASVSGVANATVGEGYTPPSFSAGTITAAGAPAFAAVNYSAAVTKSGTNYILSIASTSKNFGTFNWLNDSYSLTSETVTISAVFTSKGVFSSGTETITGSVAACTTGCPGGKTWKAGSGTLFKGTLKSASVDTTHDALGFSVLINNSYWSGDANSNGLKYGFTPGASSTESLWLFSTAANTGTVPSLTTFTTNGLKNLEGTTGSGGTSGGVLNQSTGNLAWNAFLAALSAGGTGLKAQTMYSIGSYTTVPLPMSGLLLTGGLAGLGLFARRRPAAVAA